MGKTYGYARVSSRDQNLDRQLDVLADFGVDESQVFADKEVAETSTAPNTRGSWTRCTRATRSWSKASTGSGAITMIFWSSDEGSRRSLAWLS